MGKPRSTFEKRAREQKKREKRREKARRKAEREAAKKLEAEGEAQAEGEADGPPAESVEAPRQEARMQAHPGKSQKAPTD